MTYNVYSLAGARTLTAQFQSLDEAKAYVSKKKTKYGHHILDSNGNEVFRTGKAKQF